MEEPRQVFIKYPERLNSDTLGYFPIVISDALYSAGDRTHYYRGGSDLQSAIDALASSADSMDRDTYKFFRYRLIPTVSSSISYGSDKYSNFTKCFTMLPYRSDGAFGGTTVYGFKYPTTSVDSNGFSIGSGYQPYSWLPRYSAHHGLTQQVYTSESYSISTLAFPSRCYVDGNLVFSTSTLSRATSTTSKLKSVSIAFRHYFQDSHYGNDWVAVVTFFNTDVDNTDLTTSYSESISDIISTVSEDPFITYPSGTGGPASTEQGGDGTGGGWGDFDYSSDGPQSKDPPTLSTYDAGFCTLYAATQAQIKALADYMWADTGDLVNNWHKLWANPMDAILGISLVPLEGLLSGTSTAVKVGNITTTVYMTRLSGSIVQVSCGSLHITSQSLSHSFMDFPPYNQVQLYLPYIGTVEISATDVIDKYLSVSYLCDCLSGACVAFVMSNSYTIATYSGNIAAAVPVTSGDFANIVFAALDYLKVAGGGMATAAALSMAIPTGGLSAMALPMAVGLGAAGLTAAASQKQKDFQIGQSILVPQITKGGTAGSIAGYMNHQKPFLIFNAPNVAAPENMNTYIGYAQYETKTLGACSGFTKVAEIHYRGAGTEAERAEIENLLRMGVDL